MKALKMSSPPWQVLRELRRLVSQLTVHVGCLVQ